MRTSRYDAGGGWLLRPYLVPSNSPYKAGLRKITDMVYTLKVSISCQSSFVNNEKGETTVQDLLFIAVPSSTASCTACTAPTTATAANMPRTQLAGTNVRGPANKTQHLSLGCHGMSTSRNLKRSSSATYGDLWSSAAWPIVGAPHTLLWISFSPWGWLLFL